MGKDQLAGRHDLWTTRNVPARVPVDRPDHPRRTFAFDRRSRPPASSPAFSFATFRVVSPLLAPLMLGGACFTLLLLLSVLTASTQLAADPTALLPIFFIFAAVGVVLAAALAYAPNDTIWAIMLIAGLITNGTITVWMIFGPVAGIALILGLSLLLALIVRKQAHTVLENSVHAMVLFGKHNRTLRPGFNLRLPGEQVWAILQTGDVTVDVAAQDIVLADGTRVAARASALCRIVPERAHQAAAHSTDWPQQVQHCLELTLREILGETGPDALALNDSAARDLSQHDPLPARLRGHLQHLVAAWGISVEWVRPHSLTAMPAPLTQMLLRQTPAASSVAPRPDVASGAHAATRPASQDAFAQPAVTFARSQAFSQPSQDVYAVRGLTPGALLPLPPAMRSGVPVPEALAEAYAAVREQRITDPTTISRIALAFEKVAGDPIMGPHLPFDAGAAARLLRELAMKRELV